MIGRHDLVLINLRQLILTLLKLHNTIIYIAMIGRHDLVLINLRQLILTLLKLHITCIICLEIILGSFYYVQAGKRK